MNGWTLERELLLRQLWASGVSASDIGRRLRITRNAVIGKMHRLKLSSRLTSADASRIRAAKIKATKEKSKTRRTLVQKASPERAIAIATEPLPAERPIPPGTVTLLDLEPHHCRFPFGTTETGGITFCGCRKEPGIAYCSTHAAIYLTTYADPSRKDALRRVERVAKLEEA